MLDTFEEYRNCGRTIPSVNSVKPNAPLQISLVLVPYIFVIFSCPITTVPAGGQEDLTCVIIAPLFPPSGCPQSEFGCVCLFSSTRCKAMENSISSWPCKPSTLPKHVCEN